MSKNKTINPKKTIITASVLLSALIGFTIFNSGSKVTIINNNAPSITPENFKPLTVASAWQGEVKALPNANKMNEHLSKKDESNGEEKGFVLDYAMIQQEIGNIRLTEDGNIIIDDIALKALRRAFPPYRLNLTPEMLDEIEEIMKKGLPGVAGIEAADIIRKFYEYAQAKKEMASVYRDINLSQGSREEAEAQEESLRTLYLGEELAAQLFEKEDKETSYMHSTFEIATNNDMTAEQKEEAKRKLSIEYLSSLIDNWETRFHAYQVTLNSIKQDSSLSEAEIKDAIINLQKDSFTIEEFKAIRRANVNL